MFLTPRFHSSRSVRRQLSEHGPCPRLVHDASTNSRTGRPPLSGGGECSRFGCKDFRQNLKAGRSRSYLTLSAACPRRVHKLADWAPPLSGGGECSRFGCKDFRQNLKAGRSRSYLTLSAACPRRVHKLADWAPPFSGGGECSRFGCKDFRQNLKVGRSRSYLIFDENPYIQNASAVRCPDGGRPVRGLSTTRPQTRGLKSPARPVAFCGRIVCRCVAAHETCSLPRLLGSAPLPP
jgi:hypothetical protein